MTTVLSLPDGSLTLELANKGRAFPPTRALVIVVGFLRASSG
jgi:hypothetical protein